jgi:hypothetical protein
VDRILRGQTTGVRTGSGLLYGVWSDGRRPKARCRIAELGVLAVCAGPLGASRSTAGGRDSRVVAAAPPSTPLGPGVVPVMVFEHTAVREIDRALNVVFEYVADPSRQAEWSPSVKRCRLDGPLAEGVVARQTAVVFGREREIPRAR